MAAENEQPEDGEESDTFLSEEDAERLAAQLDGIPSIMGDLSIFNEELVVPDYSNMEKEEVELASRLFSQEVQKRYNALYPGSPQILRLPSGRSASISEEVDGRLNSLEILMSTLAKLVETLAGSSAQEPNTVVNVNINGQQQGGHSQALTPSSSPPSSASSASPSGVVEITKEQITSLLSELTEIIQQSTTEGQISEESEQRIREIHEAFIGARLNPQEEGETLKNTTWSTSAEELFQPELLKQAWTSLQAFVDKSKGNPTAQQVLDHLQEIYEELGWKNIKVSDVNGLVVLMKQVEAQKLTSLKEAAEKLYDKYIFDDFDRCIYPEDKHVVLALLRELKSQPNVTSPIAEMIVLMCKKPQLLITHVNDKLPAQSSFAFNQDDFEDKDISAFIAAVTRSSNFDTELARSLRVALADFFAQYVPWGYKMDDYNEHKYGFPLSVLPLEQAKSLIIKSLNTLESHLKQKGFESIPDAWTFPVFIAPNNLGEDNSLSDIAMGIKRDDDDKWMINGLPIQDVTASSPPEQLVSLRICYQNIHALLFLVDGETNSEAYSYCSPKRNNPQITKNTQFEWNDNIQLNFLVHNRFLVTVPVTRGNKKIFDPKTFSFSK